MKTIAQQLNVKYFPFEIRDKNGKQIYFENSKGYWVKYKYDSNGKEIYAETSKGYWSKREYDSNGKEIYAETSKGYWSKREYDSNGKQIYFENSYGKVIDNRPKRNFTFEEVEKIVHDVMNLGMKLRQDQLNGTKTKSGDQAIREYLVLLNQLT